VLKLVEEKRLSLSDSLGALLPDVPADKKGITIHQLLTHTAGLGGS
jgi:CubicO group peptidase (beta-lactamase class C family)